MNAPSAIRKTLSAFLLIPLIILGGLPSCTGWKMDYSKPAAQFHQKDVLAKAKLYIGKKITIKGAVERVDLSDPENAWVHLKGGIRCNFGKFRLMAKDNEPGETVSIDGFLRRCESGDILLDPASNRDRTAAFNPQ